MRCDACERFCLRSEPMDTLGSTGVLLCHRCEYGLGLVAPGLFSVTVEDPLVVREVSTTITVGE